jgi:hypothetical protein
MLSVLATLTLRIVAFFFCSEHPTKKDITSIKISAIRLGQVISDISGDLLVGSSVKFVHGLIVMISFKNM